MNFPYFPWGIRHLRPFFFLQISGMPQKSCGIPWPVVQRFSASCFCPPNQQSLLQILGLFQFGIHFCREVSLVSSPDHIFVSSKLKDRALNVAVWDTALQMDTATLEVSDHRALIAQFDAWWIWTWIWWCFGRISNAMAASKRCHDPGYYSDNSNLENWHRPLLQDYHERRTAAMWSSFIACVAAKLSVRLDRMRSPEHTR